MSVDRPRRRRLGAVAFGALAVAPLAPAAAQARPVDPEGNDGPPATSQPDPTTANAAESHAYGAPHAVSHSAAPPVKHPAAPKPAATPKPAAAPAGPSPVIHGTTHVKPAPQATAEPKPAPKPAAHPKPAPHPAVPSGAPSPVAQGTQTVPPAQPAAAPSAPAAPAAPTVAAQATASPAAPTVPSANAAEHHHTAAHGHHPAVPPIGQQPAPPTQAGPSPVHHGTQAVPPAPVAPAQSDDDPVMHPTAADSPGQRGGELPGAGSPKVYTSKTADGPDFGKAWSKAKAFAKKQVYDTPWCADASVYRGWYGGGTGVCVDLRHHLIQHYSNIGMGKGGGISVHRLPTDTFPRGDYGSVGADGAAGPVAGADGEMRYTPGSGWSHVLGANVFGIPIDDFPWPDSVRKSLGGPKHRKLLTTPGSGTDGGGKHRAGSHKAGAHLPASTQMLHAAGETGKAKVEGSVHIGASKTYDYGPILKFLGSLGD